MELDARTAGRFFRPGPVTIQRKLAGLNGLPLNALNSQLEELYKGCGHDHGTALPNLVDDINDTIEQMLHDIYRLQGTDGTIDQAVTKYFADKLWSGVTESFGADLGDLVYDTPDYKMLASIKENVWHFSAAKNYQQLRELSDALLNENGELRTFEEFRAASKIVNDKFMKRWLKTEYDLAVAGGQMASKWADIVKNAETLKLIQFDVVMDGNTTDICRSLHGVTVPFTHPIVKRYYPPNHFNCRTTVRSLASGAITPDDKIVLPEIPAMFRTNLAQQGLVFPEGHAYFVGLPDAIKDQFKP